jgi:pimeloyl-ACP methyl ester carboxylesterase
MIPGQQDQVVGFTDAQSVQDSFVSIRTVTLEHAGHNLQLDEPDKTGLYPPPHYKIILSSTSGSSGLSP